MNKQTIIMIVDKRAFPTSFVAREEAIRATKAGVKGNVTILNALAIPAHSTSRKWHFKVEYTLS